MFPFAVLWHAPRERPLCAAWKIALQRANTRTASSPPAQCHDWYHSFSWSAATAPEALSCRVQNLYGLLFFLECPTQFQQGNILQLANALARDAKFLAYFLQCLGFAAG